MNATPSSEPAFDFWERPAIRACLEACYDLEAVTLPGFTPRLYRSRRRRGHRTAFNLPFAACAFEDSRAWLADFDRLRALARETGCNVIIKSLLSFDELPRVTVADNPVVATAEAPACYRGKFRNQLRRQWRQADAAGIVVESTHEVALLDRFYDEVLVPSYQHKHRMLVQPRALLAGILASGHATLYLARHADAILAGILCTRSTEVVHYNWGATRETTTIGLGALLVDLAIREAADQGVPWFDLGATPRTHASLRQFKTRFGPRMLPQYHYHTGDPPTTIDYHAQYRTLRRAFRWMPQRMFVALGERAVPWLAS